MISDKNPGICAFSNHSLSLFAKRIILSVAPKESQKLASYKRESGEKKRNTHPTNKRSESVWVFFPCPSAINASVPIQTARMTAVSHQTSHPYKKIERRIPPRLRIVGRGIYFEIPETSIRTNVIFDPLTTRMCDIQEVLNASLTEEERSSIFPIVIPRSMPATSRGNPSKKSFSDHDSAFSKNDGSPFSTTLKSGTNVFPYVL